MTGPIKAIITAVLLAFLRRNKIKETDELIMDPDDDGLPIINNNILSERKKIAFYSDTSEIDYNIEIHNEDKLSKLRQERIKEIKFNDLFKEIIYNSLLLFCLFSICYSVDIKTSNNYDLALKRFFNPNRNITNVIIIILTYF